jgi:hypothetical protein
VGDQTKSHDSAQNLVILDAKEGLTGHQVQGDFDLFFKRLLFLSNVFRVDFFIPVHYQKQNR